MTVGGNAIRLPGLSEDCSQAPLNLIYRARAGKESIQIKTVDLRLPPAFGYITRGSSFSQVLYNFAGN